mgnify:CR=1 FL=1
MARTYRPTKEMQAEGQRALDWIAEGKAGEAGALEGFSLGLGDPTPLSAEHGEGMSSLYDALREALPEETAEPAEDEDEGPAAV